MSPGSTEALLGDTDMVFALVVQKSMAEGASRPPLFVPHHPTAIEGQEVQEPQRWCLHLRVFWHFPCLPIGGVGNVV